MDNQEFNHKLVNGHTKLDLYECLAKIILEQMLPKELYDLDIGDRPDLQNCTLGVGIEVTQAINQEQRENEALCYMIGEGLVNKEKAIKKINSSYKPGKVMLNNEVLIDEPERYGEYVLSGIPEGDNFSRIIDSFKVKLNKLNDGGYRTFFNNYLFVYSEILADEEMIKEASKQMIVIQEGLKVKFVKVIVNVPSYIYICDLVNEEHKTIYVKDKEYCWKEMAREKVRNGKK